MEAKVGGRGIWFGMLAWAALAGCAQGAPAAPAAELIAPIAPVEAACGNGKPDANELCDCPPNVTGSCLIEGTGQGAKTCETIMNGTGKLLCDSKTCQFDLSMCMAVGGGGVAGAGR